MKAWRRAGGLGATAAAVELLIASIQGDGSPFAVVTFTLPCAVNDGQPSTVVINATGCLWSTQISATECLIQTVDSSPITPGDAWDRAGLDSETTPNLSLPQSGLITA